jgi:ketosteroid isomerase-like protein
MQACHASTQRTTRRSASGSLASSHTVQKLSIAFKNGATRQVTVRETDCFEKRNNEWQLIHQHASVPFGGDWDGKIIGA